MRWVGRIPIASWGHTGFSRSENSGYSSSASLSVRGQVTSAGSKRTYQVWFRNAASFCTPSTFNLSNGVEVTWGP